MPDLNPPPQRLRPALRAGGLLVLLLFVQPAWAQPVSAIDFRGETIALEKPAQRIICLLESALSGLYMLGAQQQIAGVSTNIYQGSVFDYYAAMDSRIRDRTLPTPGNWDFVNIESVVALQPDLVILWSGQEESIRALEEKGIPVFGVFVAEFTDIHREIRALGQLTGTSDRADTLISFAETELLLLRQRLAAVRDEDRPGVYFMWAQGALETSGRRSTVNELIELAGARNVAAGSDLEHLVVNLENLLVWNPEVVLMWWNERLDAADIGTLGAWRSLAAVRRGRVHELPDPFSCDFWTLKYLFTVELAARWCHPQLFGDGDLEALRQRLFARLYDGRLPAAAMHPIFPASR